MSDTKTISYIPAKKYPSQEIIKPKFPLNLSRNILDKINFLCSKISREEWSGVLFYTIEGSMRDLSLSIDVKDILPMDKGTSTFTGFQLDNRFIDYLMANPEALSWKVGLIHSHNIMGVFFSGTDIQELHDNAEFHNFYLSLIVNNFGDMVAKVAVFSQANTEHVELVYTALDENGQEYVLDEVTQTIPNKKLYLFDCQIKKEVFSSPLDEPFTNAVEGILKPKHVVHTSSASTYNKPPIGFKNKNPKFTGHKNAKNNRNNKGKMAEEKNYTMPGTFYENVLLKLLDESSYKDSIDYHNSDFKDKVLMIIDLYEIADLSQKDVSQALIEKLVEDYEKLFPYSGKTREDVVRNLSRLLTIVDSLVLSVKYLVNFATLLRRTIHNLQSEDNTKQVKREESWTD